MPDKRDRGVGLAKSRASGSGERGEILAAQSSLMRAVRCVRGGSGGLRMYANQQLDNPLTARVD